MSTSLQAPVITRFSDGTVVHEYTDPRCLTLRALAPGHRRIKVCIEYGTLLAQSVSARTSMAAAMARDAKVVRR